MSVGTGNVDTGNNNRILQDTIQNADQTKSTNNKKDKKTSSWRSDTTNDSGVTAVTNSSSNAGEPGQIRAKKKNDKKASQEQSGAKVRKQVNVQKKRVKPVRLDKRSIDRE